MAIKLLRAGAVFFYTLLLYLGLCLLGWGPAHLAAFFASAPQSAYALNVLLFSLLIGIQAFHSLDGIQDAPGQKEKTVSRQRIIGAALVGLLFAGLIALPFTSRLGFGVFAERPWLSWLGVALCAFGYGLVFWSGLALGKQYSAEVTIQADHQLITGGPYRLIRHPRYLGVLCLALGLCLVFHSWIGLLVSAVTLGLLLSRIYDEEALLLREFGGAWRAYCRRSWKLIPYIF